MSESVDTNTPMLQAASPRTSTNCVCLHSDEFDGLVASPASSDEQRCVCEQQAAELQTVENKEEGRKRSFSYLHILQSLTKLNDTRLLVAVLNLIQT